MTRLPKVIPGLLTHHLDGQVVAFDSQNDKVHLLDATTGCVLNLLTEGKSSVDEIVGELRSRTGLEASSDLVALSIDELRKSKLIEADSDISLSEVSRREAVRRVAAAGIAAVLVPAVISFAPSTAYAQASACTAAKVPAGCPCNGNGNCASGNCVAGTCA